MAVCRTSVTNKEICLCCLQKIQVIAAHRALTLVKLTEFMRMAPIKLVIKVSETIYPVHELVRCCVELTYCILYLLMMNE